MKINLLKCEGQNPVNISVGSARTCYSQTIKTPEDIESWSKKKELLIDLFKSGHHTTLQHVHFTFLIEGISRFALWRFFHSHRYYNSDQVSQRYAEVRRENFKTLGFNEEEELYDKLMENYHKIVDILEPIFKEDSNKVISKSAKKRAMENARYILPQSVTANLYHTVNLSTLVRYYAACDFVEDPASEIKEVCVAMKEVVCNEYPDLEELFEVAKKQFSKTKIEDPYTQNNTFLEEFLKGRSDYPEAKVLSMSFFQGADSPFHGDTTGAGLLFPGPHGLSSVSTFMYLSLSADSQNQRHRTSHGVRPSLKRMIDRWFHQRISGHYIPGVIKENEKALNIFIDSIELLNHYIEENKSIAPYLLPNSFKVPVAETMPFNDFAHKMSKRLCLNSQEEIRNLAFLLTNMLKSKYGFVGSESMTKLLSPPCYSRYKDSINPICPEGPRFCGVKEWLKEKKYS